MEIKNKWIIKDDYEDDGGSGEVFICNDIKTNKEYILKKLKGKDVDKIRRFNREIEILQDLKEKNDKGVIQIIDSYLNYDNFENEKFKWYVIEKGTPLIKIADQFFTEHSEINNLYGNYSKWYVFFKHYLFLLKTLNRLHQFGIFHRDIKPENIIYFKNRLVFIDFGIAQNQKIESDITENNKHDKLGLGPKFYSPPEMKRNPLKANLEKVDVYCITKTLWALISQKYDIKKEGLCSFDGEFNSITHSIEDRIEFRKTNIEILNEIFIRNTSDEPENRLSIQETINKIEDFIFYEFQLYYGLGAKEYHHRMHIKYLIEKTFNKLNQKYNKIKLQINNIDNNIIDLISSTANEVIDCNKYKLIELEIDDNKLIISLYSHNGLLKWLKKKKIKCILD